MTIQAVQTVASTCETPWCAEHIPSCISVEQVVEVEAGGEQHRVCVSLEQAQGEPVAVRVMGAADAPMSPQQALQLAAVLTTLAFAAVSGQVA